MNTRYSITDLIVLLLVVFAGMWAYSTFVNPGTAVTPPTMNRPQTIPVEPAFNPTPGHQPTPAAPTPIVPEYTIDIEEAPTTILVAPATYTPTPVILPTSAPTTAACNQPPMNMTDMICKYNIADVQACTTAIQNNAWLSDICQQMKAELIYMAGANNGSK